MFLTKVQAQHLVDRMLIARMKLIVSMAPPKYTWDNLNLYRKGYTYEIVSLIRSIRQIDDCTQQHLQLEYACILGELTSYYPDIKVPEVATQLMKLMVETSMSDSEVLVGILRVIGEAPETMATVEECRQWGLETWWISGFIPITGTPYRSLVAMLPWLLNDVSLHISNVYFHF
jgi:hypothetical protein